MQFEYSKLRGKIKEVFGTQDAFAKALDMSRNTLSQKLNNNTEFTQSEIILAMDALGLCSDMIDDYFFTLSVQKTRQ